MQKILICLSILPLVSLTGITENRRQDMPHLHINHIFLVLDAAVYKSIASSEFLQREFAVFERRTTIRSDSRYTGIYFYGTSTYFEFFDAAVETIGPVGYSGLALGVDQAGDLERMRPVLSKSSRVQIDDVTRGWKDEQVPWFRMLWTEAASPRASFPIWIMEYDPRFLRQWHPHMPPKDPGVSRRQVLQRYAAVLGEHPEDRHLQDLIGITVAAAPDVVASTKMLCETMGCDIREKDGIVTIQGTGWRIQFIPESSPRGIQGLEFRIRSMPEQREFRFGTDCVLKFQDKGTATWSF